MAPTGGPGGGGNIKVVVRVRPFNNRELDRNAKCIVQMRDAQTVLQPPPEAEERLRKGGKGSEAQRTFKFDKSYWSFNQSDSHFAGQDDLFTDLGGPLLDNAFQGYNNCIFAYGQTGSGKSYSMMGYGDQPGVIPRICRDMFERISDLQTDKHLTCTVEVSYLEIYNEKVRDLLNPATKGNLKVREHPSTGPYVEDLAKLAVRSFAEIENLMDEGNKARTVAATNMNETSSRSHAVFTLTLTQKRHDVETSMDTERVAKISLVDLAGSERATSTGATGARLKEGAEINRSLSTLGRVIAALADLSSGKKSLKVPYRDSVLTWLLKDSLGGNSMTAMIAAISPADINFEETLSTLRYADSAKRIKNHAVVNEDPNARMIRELKEELAQLRSKLGSGGVGAGMSEESYPPGTPLSQQFVSIIQADGSSKRVSKAEIAEQLSQSEKLYKDLNQTWEEKLQKTEEIHKEREAALEELGISIEKGNIGLSTPKKMPHLVNLSDDPLLAECLVYNLKPGVTTVGNVNAENAAEIRVNGSRILDQHCKLENVENVVTIVPSEGASIMVNGVRVDKARRLKSGNRIILGDFHIFRFNNPLEAKAERHEQSLLRHSITASQLNSPTPYRPSHERTNSTTPSEMDGDSSRAESPRPRGRDSDWSFARREAAGALLGSDQKISHLTDDELNLLFDNIQRAREERRARPESRFFDNEDDSDDLSSFLVRDKYMSNGTTDNFSLDTALTIPGTPIYGDEVEDETDMTLTAVQNDMQQELDDRKAEAAEQLRVAEALRSKDELEEQKKQMEKALEDVKRDFEEQLRKQKETFEEQVKQMTPQRTSTTRKSRRRGYSDLTQSELSVARSVVDRWQRRNYVRIAESILQYAGLLKEAQVLSKIMNKNVSFQFAVLDPGQEKASSYDEILKDIDADDFAFPDTKKPRLGIRVMDAKASVIHIWSIDKLKHRVSNMRRMHQYIDKPEYIQHFRLENPFSESYQPSFSLIGDGGVPLTAVYETRVQDFTINIVSPYTQNPIGKLRLSLEPSLAEATNSTIKFNIVMRNMSGFAEYEGTNVHAQMSVLDASGNEGIATTQTIEGFREGLVRFESVHSLSVPQKGGPAALLKIAMYAQVTSMHLDKLTSWDEIRESADRPQEAPQTHRVPESEYNREERHDIFAKIQMLELAENGQYLPVEVVQSSTLDDGVYQLHQGLQRRVMISLTYNPTESLPWDDLCSLCIGQVHLVDSSGKVTDLENNSADIQLKQIQEPMIRDNADGTSNVSIIGQWDSSLHRSLRLDRATPDCHKVRVTIRWEIVSSRLEQHMSFSIDQHLQILPRSYTRPQSILRSFWSHSRITHSTDGLFSVTVHPPSTQKATDLWRLDTAKNYINGEEHLENWSPRSISLIKDYMSARLKRRQLEDIEAAKGAFGAHNLVVRRDLASTSNLPVEFDASQEALVRKHLALWQKPHTSMSHPVFDTDLSSSQQQSQPQRTDAAASLNVQTNSKATANVTHHPKNPVSLKSGYLLAPSPSHQDASYMQWIRRFISLHPPYLHIYSTQPGGGFDALNAINLTHARIDADPDFVRLLGGSTPKTGGADDNKGGLGHVFAVYGEQNTFLFAARSEVSKGEWIWAMDRGFMKDGEGDDGGS